MPVRSKTDLVLALLFAGDSGASVNAPIGGITRLEKLVFLVSQEKNGILSQLDDPTDVYEFRPYKMGPFSPEVYDEIDFLKGIGLIADSPIRDSTGAASVERDELLDEQLLDKYTRTDHSIDESPDVKVSLSTLGLEAGRRAFESLTPDEQRFLLDLKQRFNRVPLKDFLRYVYKKYPQYASKSEIREYLGL